MKTLKVKTILFSLSTVLTISFFLTSCEQQLPINPHIEKEDFLTNLDMLENDFEPEPVIVEFSHPLNPEQIISMPIENIDATNGTLEDRQRLISILRFAKNSDVGNLTYHILPSITTCVGGYTNAIVDAANYWSNLSGCKVNLTRTYSEPNADIVFGCDNDTYFQTNSPGHYNISSGALGQWPLADRTVGRYISINDSRQPSNYMKGLMMHEIGHSLGLDHPGRPTWHMPGTPVSWSDDKDALMIGNVDVNVMSPEDKKAFRRLWPDQLKKPTNVSYTRVNGNDVRIQLQNPDPTVRPYNHVNVGHWYNGNFNWGHGSYDDDGTFNFTWDGNFPSGTHYFYVQGGSHNNEVLSPYSGWQSIVIP